MHKRIIKHGTVLSRGQTIQLLSARVDGLLFADSGRWARVGRRRLEPEIMATDSPLDLAGHVTVDTLGEWSLRKSCPAMQGQ